MHHGSFKLGLEVNSIHPFPFILLAVDHLTQTSLCCRLGMFTGVSQAHINEQASSYHTVGE